MSFDFPNTPTNGDKYQPAGGPTYIYSNGVWLQAPADQLASLKTARERNRILNPSAHISQENGTAVTGSGTYPADQWYCSAAGITVGYQRATLPTPTPEGSQTGISATATTAKASLAAGDLLLVSQPIEGTDVIDLQWGTASAKAVVLRFCAICDQVGTFSYMLRNSAADRCYVGSFTIAQAGVPQVFVQSIPGDTTGTWLKDTGVGIWLRFSYATGSTYVGVAGWQAGTFYAPPGCTNGAAIANSKLYLSDVGFYKDVDNCGIAPPFEPPAYGEELIRVQRYWEQLGFTVTALAASNYIIQHYYSAVKRAIPSFTLVSGNPNGATFDNSNNGLRSIRQAAVASAVGDVQYKINARLA